MLAHEKSSSMVDELANFQLSDLLDIHFVGRWGHDATHVVPAIWADDVSRCRCATFRAQCKWARFDSIVGSAFARTGIRMFSLWNSHDLYLTEGLVCIFDPKF